MECVNGIGVANPLSCKSPFYVLIETQGSVEAHDVAKLEVRPRSYRRLLQILFPVSPWSQVCFVLILEISGIDYGARRCSGWCACTGR